MALRTMTAGDLRKAIEGVEDGMEVILRISKDDLTAVCGLHQASVDAGCTEKPVLMLDGHLDEDEVEEVEEGATP